MYAAVTLASASRHLWFDELFTYWIAQAPSIRALLSEISLDLQPPLGYLAVRGSLAVLGDSAFATRFPSMISFLVGSLCLYAFVSRRLRPVYGLLAMLVFWSTPFLTYATEARPYALVVGFFGIAMLAWQRAIEPGRSGAWIVLLGVAVLGMMFSHFFAVFYIAPFCLAELWRYLRSRRVDWAMWVALLLPAVVPLFYLSRVHAYQSMALPPVQQASPFKVLAFFYHTLEPEGIVLLIATCVGLAVAFRREHSAVEQRALMRPVEVVFTAGVLSIPALLNLVLMRTHGAFFPRYGIPTLFAYGLLLAFFMAMSTNVNGLAAGVACCILLVSIGGTTAVSATLSALRTWGRKTAAQVQPPALEQVRPDLPLVAASGLTFLEMNKYESAKTLARLYYLNDREFALRYAHATIFEGPFPDLKKYFPIRGTFEPYRKFVAEHPHFLVVGLPGYAEDWLIPRLMDIHATLVYLGEFPIPYMERQIFEVTMPSGSGPGVPVASASGLADADVLNLGRQFHGAQSAATVDHERAAHFSR